MKTGKIKNDEIEKQLNEEFNQAEDKEKYLSYLINDVYTEKENEQTP